jgi:hypothetical protein
MSGGKPAPSPTGCAGRSPPATTVAPIPASPDWCEIHHIHEWERGGDTALSNLVMLCSVHHREIHSSGWSVRIAADGLPEFIPPPWIDLEQKPRRNPTVPRPDIGRPLQPI